jgi:hypothetical protein
MDMKNKLLESAFSFNILILIASHKALMECRKQVDELGKIFFRWKASKPQVISPGLLAKPTSRDHANASGFK